MAAVARVETSAENRIGRVLQDTSSELPIRTEERGKQASLLGTELLGQTRAAAGSSPTSIITEASAPQHPTTMPLTAGVRKISGVIAEVMRDSVVIQCTLPSETVDLRLPPALVPNNLMSFGTPVWISLDTTGGIRTPVIESRPIDSQPRMDGQDAIEDWLNST